jgi:hypothetical protein
VIGVEKSESVISFSKFFCDWFFNTKDMSFTKIFFSLVKFNQGNRGRGIQIWGHFFEILSINSLLIVQKSSFYEKELSESAEERYLYLARCSFWRWFRISHSFCFRIASWQWKLLKMFDFYWKTMKITKKARNVSTILFWR